MKRARVDGGAIFACAAWLAVAAGALHGAEVQGPGEVKRLEAECRERQQAADAAKKQLAAAKRQAAQEKSQGPAQPDATQFMIPKLTAAPKIDGAVDAAEWAGAVGVPLPAWKGGTVMLKRPGATVYLGWDGEHLFGAQRLALREGERLVRLCREPRRDNVAPHESAIEFFVDRKSQGSHGSACRWQFMGNASGNRFEREDQYEIGQNFVDWDGEWQYAQRVTPDGKYWEVEFAIPRKTVYQSEPLRDGDVWWIGVAADLHRPWTWNGYYGYGTRATFREALPEIRMSHPQRSLELRGIGFDLSVRNTTAAPFEGRLVYRLYSKDRDPAKQRVVFEGTRPIGLAPGAARTFDVRDAVEAHAQGGRIAVSVECGGQPVYTWSTAVDYADPEADYGLAFVPDKAAFALKTAYNPLSNYVRFEADTYDFAQAGAVASARCAVGSRADGKSLAEGRITAFPFGKGEVRVDVPAALEPGEYPCSVELLDAAGKTLARESASFVRKDHKKEFPWLTGNRIGEQDEVLPGFAPLSVRGDTVKGFRKEIVVNGSALPERITAAGVPLLRSPVVLEGEADGAPFALAPARRRPELRKSSETRARYRGEAAGGPLAASVVSEWEYDGTCKVELTLTPAKGRATARFDRLRLVVPFTAEGGVSYMANGENMRLSNQAGLIPKPGAPERLAGVANWLPGAPESGAVWNSTSVRKQAMTVGSFVPFMWVGNLRGGLTWFADSDEGWWPTDKVPAIEIRRDGEGRASLVLNLAGEAAELTGPRRIVFGLHVNPVREPGEAKGSRLVFGYLKESGRWDGKTLPQAFARRYPDNLELNRKYVGRCHRFNSLFGPYTEMSWMDFETDVAEYFREEWDRGGLGGPLHVKSSLDYLLWLTDRWIRDAGLDGFYFDNVFNRINYNTHAGTAYRLPDGRVQPGYNLWGMRDHIKRIRGVLAQRKGGAPFYLCIHNTRFQFAPILGFANVAMGGEMPTPRGDNPRQGDWMDMHPREFMTVMYNQPLWGYRLSHLYHFRSDSYLNEFGEPDAAAALKAHRGAMASMLINGVEFFQGNNYGAFLQPQFQLLKQAAGGELRFQPGWDSDGLFRLEPADSELDAALWRGENHVLLVVCNWSKKAKTAGVWLDFPKLLRLPEPLRQRVMMDFETLEGFKPWSTGGDGLLAAREFPDDPLPKLDRDADPTLNIPNTLRLKVAPRDFRAVLIGNLPLGGSGAGF
ncbi:MAG: DUF6067 family protein [Kiritimatiellia bacterium]|jgi:hypothetical protein|nr:DUF6067 family protein [Kiritimatiellia bacterium]